MFKRDIPKVKDDDIRYLKHRMVHWVYSNTHRYPWRTTKSKFHALIAEILLQRTRAEQVIPIYKKFVKTFPSTKTLAYSSFKKISQIIAPLGLRWRAWKIKELGTVLYKKYKGTVPAEIDELLSLPSIGPYAASAFLSFHRSKRGLLIDSNTVRVYGRFFGFEVHAETRREKGLAKLVETLTPRHRCKRFNYSVLDLGRNVCQQRPLCSICPISPRCHYYKKEKK